MKTCGKCRESLPIEAFNKHRNRGDGLQGYCRQCYSGVHKAYYQDTSSGIKNRRIRTANQSRKRNQKIVCQYLQANPCIDCGEADPVVLHFDHVRGEKFRDISQLMRGASTDTLLAEIAKCEIRCANCHMRVTAARANWTKCSAA